MNHEPRELREPHPSGRLRRLAPRSAFALPLLAACAILTACQTNPFESKVKLSYLMIQTAETETRTLDVEGVSGILRDDVSNLKAEARLETKPDGSVTHVVTLGGETATDSGNQFRALDSIIGFLVGVFAGGVTP
jgi:hypothetical protein